MESWDGEVHLGDDAGGSDSEEDEFEESRNRVGFQRINQKDNHEENFREET